MSLAKEIRKEGESWNDARARASKMMKEETKTVTKKVESELDKLSKLVRSKKELRGQVGKTNLLIDAKRKAKPINIDVYVKLSSSNLSTKMYLYAGGTPKIAVKNIITNNTIANNKLIGRLGDAYGGETITSGSPDVFAN
jgi:hypothetical protein